MVNSVQHPINPRTNSLVCVADTIPHGHFFRSASILWVSSVTRLKLNDPHMLLSTHNSIPISKEKSAFPLVTHSVANEISKDPQKERKENLQDVVGDDFPILST